MNRKRIVLASLAAGLTLSLATAVSAQTQQGCPAAFEPMTIAQVTAIASGGFTEADFRAADTNADNLLCVKIFENFPERNPVINFDPTFLFQDNFVGN